MQHMAFKPTTKRRLGVQASTLECCITKRKRDGLVHIRHDGKRLRTANHKEENDAACALNKLAKEVKGGHASTGPAYLLSQTCMQTYGPSSLQLHTCISIRQVRTIVGIL